MKKQSILIAFIIIIFITGLTVFYFYHKQSSIISNIDTPDGIINSVIFSCANNKTVQAVFFKDRVELTLSDGRNMIISQAVSASGARYTNTDESFIFWNKGDTAFITEKDSETFSDCSVSSNANNITSNTDPKSTTTSTTATTNIANPASTNCIKVGGTLKIETRGDGGQYGLCYFEDNRACEEWALMYGDCPVGGRKTTGYDSIDQNYCAWSGGQTYAVSNSVCTFKNGSTCSTIDFYNGKCSPVK